MTDVFIIADNIFSPLGASSIENFDEWFDFSYFDKRLTESGFDIKYENYLYFIYPLIGILLSVIYVRIFHKNIVFDLVQSK